MHSPDSYVICGRLDAAYQKMVVELKLPNESNGEFIRRAIDALALTDENLAAVLGQEDYGI